MNPPANLPLDQEYLTVLWAQSGERVALSQLIDLYDQRLLYFVRRILGDADGALDVLQTTWLTVHRKIGSLKSPAAFRVWVYRIAHDAAISELRRQMKRPVPVDDHEITLVIDEQACDEKSFDCAELVHAALHGLSIDHRRVLTLRFLEDMSIEDIASVVGCSDGTIKSRLHYAKLALRRQIEALDS